MTDVKHPAKFSEAHLEAFREILERWEPGLPKTTARDVVRILDPLAGTGRVHELQRPGIETVGVELEPEWAALHPRTRVGDATELSFRDGSFSAVVTSPAYGNRMADQYLGEKDRAPEERSRRNTYATSLGRELTPESGASLQWGPRYQATHGMMAHEMARVLIPGGILILNVKDHFRNGDRKYVTRWWIREISSRGLMFVEGHHLPTSGIPDGANWKARVDGEQVLVFERPPE